VVRPLKAEPASDLAADESGSRPQAAIPARDGIEPLARRFSACAAAGGQPTPPGRPQSPCPSWRPEDPDHDGHLERSARRLERRATRCPAAPGTDGELISELGTPQRNSPGSQEVDQATDTCGGYSEDTTADNVSSPSLRTRRDYRNDTQIRA
jgi:hypothetical protein